MKGQHDVKHREVAISGVKNFSSLKAFVTVIFYDHVSTIQKVHIMQCRSRASCQYMLCMCE